MRLIAFPLEGSVWHQVVFNRLFSHYYCHSIGCFIFYWLSNWSCPGAECERLTEPLRLGARVWPCARTGREGLTVPWDCVGVSDRAPRQCANVWPCPRTVRERLTVPKEQSACVWLCDYLLSSILMFKYLQSGQGKLWWASNDIWNYFIGLHWVFIVESCKTLVTADVPALRRLNLHYWSLFKLLLSSHFIAGTRHILLFQRVFLACR